MATQITHLQNRIVECTLEARRNPRLWPVVDALKSTLTALIVTSRMKAGK